MQKRPYYIGVANPKGESVLADTTYFDEQQLRALAPQMKGLPVHINHIRQFEDGEKVPPSGWVLAADVSEKTGELYVAFALNDSPFGEFAKQLIGERPSQIDHPPMKELSLGYKIYTKTLDGGKTEVVANGVEELSICHKGARKGTELKAKVTDNKIFLLGEKDDKEKKDYITPPLFKSINNYFQQQ